MTPVEAMGSGPVVITVGHPDRGDDAIAHLVAAALAERASASDPTPWRHIDVGDDLLTLATRWDPDDDVVVVDACHRGAPVGTVVVVDAIAEPERLGILSTPTSGHGHGVADGIELARRLGRLPRSLCVMAIEGIRFGLGPPSPELAEAVPVLADRLAELLEHLAGTNGTADGPRDLGPCPVPPARRLHEGEPTRKEGAAMTLTASDNANRQSVAVDADAWVIGIDGSDPAHHALDWALEHASGRASALHLVSAWQTPVMIAAPTPGPVTVPFDDDRLAESARQIVGRLADEARVRISVPVEPIVIHDNAAHALLDAADHAALLVVGSRGRGGFASLLLGSTSHQCATHARVPTVVVPPDAPTQTANRILVGVDGSTNSVAALTWALEFAEPGTAVRVMWAWDAAPLAVGAEDYFFPDLSDTAEARFDELVESTLAASPAPGVAVTREFARGRPRALLAEAAEGADLVVIGARGHGAVGSALLGSVATWILHHVDRPIAVIPGHPVDAGR